MTDEQVQEVLAALNEAYDALAGVADVAIDAKNAALEEMAMDAQNQINQIIERVAVSA